MIVRAKPSNGMQTLRKGVAVISVTSIALAVGYMVARSWKDKPQRSRQNTESAITKTFAVVPLGSAGDPLVASRTARRTFSCDQPSGKVVKTASAVPDGIALSPFSTREERLTFIEQNAEAFGEVFVAIERRLGEKHANAIRCYRSARHSPNTEIVITWQMDSTALKANLRNPRITPMEALPEYTLTDVERCIKPLLSSGVLTPRDGKSFPEFEGEFPVIYNLF